MRTSWPHGQETQVHGDSGYTGLDKRDEITSAQAEGKLKDIDWRIAMKRGQLQAMPEGPRKALYEWFERRKAQVRAKAQAALVNLYIVKRKLLDEQFRLQAAR